MKGGVKIIFYTLAVAVSAGLIYVAFLFVRKDKLSQINSYKSQAKKEYLTHQYVNASNTYKLLRDSFKIQEDPIDINYANALYLSYNLNENLTNDSARNALIETAIAEYSKLSSANDNAIRSIAANQQGVATLKKNETFSKNNTLTDSVLSLATGYFKEALRQDPNNEHARYNYELLKKITGFSETILSETKALVAQKKYKEAANVLQHGMRRDKRLEQHKELLTRIQAVAKIDSLNMNTL